MNLAVILSGGSGLRLGSQLPKQFMKIAGKMVIEHTIEVFQNHKEIDEIVIVSNPQFVNEIENICTNNEFFKVKKILNGGRERFHSSLSAINAFQDDNINIIFHDAVRPLVNDKIISDCIENLKKYNAVDVAIRTTDTIVEVNENNFINYIPDRNKLRNGQTPQAFKLGTIRRAYELALSDQHFQSTDDCGVVLKYLPDEPIFVVEGEGYNMKLTYKEDLYLLDKLFQVKSINRSFQKSSINIKEDVLNKVVVIFGGSYGIGLEIEKEFTKLGARVFSFSRSINNVNIANVEDVRRALIEVFNSESRIDYVINTAAVLQKEPFVNMNYSDIINGININYLGAIQIAKESFKYLKESKGHLLLFTSSSYTRGRSMYSLYSSSKAAIVNFTQAISEEWNSFGVKVNCMNPERTKTPMRKKNFGNEPDESLLLPQDVALASIEVLISNITGQVIDVKIIND